MAERDGAAMRRRQRRLRSWWRHEQQSIAAVLATGVPPIEPQGGHQVTSTGEEVEYVKHPHGHRRLHLRGMRPRSLAEPEPQRSDRSLRRSSLETPLLG